MTSLIIYPFYEADEVQCALNLFRRIVAARSIFTDLANLWDNSFK